MNAACRDRVRKAVLATIEVVADVESAHDLRVWSLEGRASTLCRCTKFVNGHRPGADQLSSGRG
jgi:hypothetical protein